MEKDVRRIKDRDNFFCHLEAKEDVILTTGAKKLFPHNPNQTINNDPVCDHLAGFIGYSTRYFNACCKLTNFLKVDDVVIIPHTTSREIYGVARWMNTIPLENRPRIIFIFINPDFQWTIDESGCVQGDFSQIRLGANILKDIMPIGRVHYFADNQLLAEPFARALDYPCKVCPMTIDYLNADDLEGDKNDPDWCEDHIGIIGQFRSEKGSNYITNSLLSFGRKRPGKSVFIQVHSEKQGDFIEQKLKNYNGKLTIFMGQISQKAYIHRLESLSLILLPYVKERYAIRSSGIFAEAAGFGIPVVVPNGTWMSRMLSSGYGAGLIFKDYSADTISDALADATDNIFELRGAAHKGKAKWRETNSTKALFRLVLSQLN